MQLACVAPHGAYQSFAQFLQGKGLLRAMSGADRARLLQQSGKIDCVNCGATLAISRLKRRLDALGADMPRRRDWVRQIEAETRARSAFGQSESPGDDPGWSSLFTSGTNPFRAKLLALVIWFVWSYW